MASHPQLALDSQLCLPLYAAARGITRRYAEFLGAVGLTYPQYLTMLALWDADEPLTVGEVGERLHLDSGTLTPVLKRLEAAGYVERRRDAADERRVRLVVTRRGDALQEKVADVPRCVWSDLGVSLDDAQRLRGLLDQLLVGLDAAPAT